MIGSPQQNAAQAHAVAGYRKGDDLPVAVGKILVVARPAGLEHECLVPRLPLLGELLAALHRERRRLHLGERVQLLARQREERIQLFCQYAVELHIVHGLLFPMNSDAASVPLALDVPLLPGAKYNIVLIQNPWDIARQGST